jgi:competence protein ComEC
MKRNVLALALAVGVFVARSAAQQPPTMTVHFINVGQALSALVEFPCGVMLVDTGAQDDSHDAMLIAYIKAFFATHPQFDSTIENVLITHNHLDHTFSLPRVVDTFKVKRYFDNGFTTGSGSDQTNALRDEVEAGERDIEIRAINDSDITSLPTKTGLTDGDIDPFNCGSVNPQVRVLTGRLSSNPGWTQKQFKQQNNHSLITRIDFGESSFLFMGDSEEASLDLTLGYYTGGDRAMLDADVMQVGHHGSHNATTADWLQAVTPSVAVVPVGKHTFGADNPGGFNTFTYGHPRLVTMNLLSSNISRKRSAWKWVMAANGQMDFDQTKVTKAIYGTAWDGNIRVTADTNGKLTVRTQF